MGQRTISLVLGSSRSKAVCPVSENPIFLPLSGSLGTVGNLLGVLPRGSFLDHGAPTSPPQNFHGRCTAAPQVPERIKPRR
jgi:hypothetical protein